MTKAQEMLKACGYILNSSTQFEEEYVFEKCKSVCVLFNKTRKVVSAETMHLRFELINAINARIEELVNE